jgi:hypothetical protein
MARLLVQTSGDSVSCYVVERGFSVSPEVLMTADAARKIAESLLTCAAALDRAATPKAMPKTFRLKVESRVDELATEIAKLKRDQQQILTALQEVARKVGRHERMALTSHISVNVSDAERASEVAQAIGKSLSERVYPC